MDERLAYRVRTATNEDDAALRSSIGTTLAHPDGQGKRESYRGAAGRGELLVLERFDRQEHVWHTEGFVEHHLRVDDALTIRDVGTAGDIPQVGVVRHLLEEVLGSLRPNAAHVKIRRDAEHWLEIFQAIPGFEREGEEYRRPHYWTVWQWDPGRAREATRRSPSPREPRAPLPYRPPARPDDRASWRGPSDSRPRR